MNYHPCPPEVSSCYNWTFDCQPQGPADALMQCTCGLQIVLTRPVFRACAVVTCHQCNSWHSVLFDGPVNPADSVRDSILDWRLALEEVGIATESLGTHPEA